MTGAPTLPGLATEQSRGSFAARPTVIYHASMPPNRVHGMRRWIVDALREDRRSVLHAALAVLAVFAFTLHGLNLSYAPPAKDGVHYLTAAYNLVAHGTFSRARRPNPEPGHYREPLWPAVLAAGIWLHPSIDTDVDSGPCIYQGEGACVGKVSQLKLLSVVLMLGAAWLAALAAFAFTGWVVPAVVAFGMVAFSLGLGREANRFYSEPAGAATLAALSLGLLHAARRPPPWSGALGVGALAGLACLTKAIFQPLLLLLPVLLAGVWAADGAPRRRWLRSGALVLLGGLLVAGPWMLRNQIRFGSPAISGRQHNLLYRAGLSELPFSAYGDAFLYFTPEVFPLRARRQAAVESGTVRLLDNHHPEGAYQAGHARLMVIKREAAASGRDWDGMAREKALEQIRDHPLGYLLMSAPLAWHGIFAEYGWGIEPGPTGEPQARALWGVPPLRFQLPARNPEAQFLSSLLLFGSFVACLGAAALRRRLDLALYLLPAAYGFACYVLVSHMVTRFSVPFLPTFAVCTVVVGDALVRRVAPRSTP